MNFNLHERDLKDFLSDDLGERYRGVYVISRHKNDTSFKIGVSYGKGGLFNRLKSYKICWPYEDEYYLHFAALTFSADDAKILEKSLLNHSTIKNKLIKWVDSIPQARLSKEYKVLAKRDVIMNAMLDTLIKHPNKWVAITTFTDHNWKICTYDGKITKSCFMKPSNTRNLMPSITDTFNKQMLL